MQKNILNVKVPQELRLRIKTGITWFDYALTVEGGMVPSLVYMLTGVPGAGKSTLTRQVANELTGAGHIVVYNSGEESEEQIAIACEKMGLKHGFGYDTLDDHRLLIKKLNKLSSENPGKRIILIQDSIQKLTRATSASVAFDELKEWAKATYNCVIVIVQVTKQGKFKGNNSVLHDSDVQIEMLHDKKSNKKRLVVSKNRFGPLTDEDGIEYVIKDTGLQPVDREDDDGGEETHATGSRFRVGDVLTVTRKGPKKHHRKTGKVTKVGRTRVTLVTPKREELYLPYDSLEPAKVQLVG